MTRRTISDKIFKDRAYETALNPKYDECLTGFASMVYKFLNKKTRSRVNINEVLVQKLQKPVIKKN